MKYSWNVGQIAGIGIYIHWTFLLVPTWVVLATLLNGGNVGSAAVTVLFIFAVFGCILLHELGHALMARRYDIGTRDITLLPIGGIARLNCPPDRPLQELAVALAGPAVNVVIAGSLLAGSLLTGVTNPWLVNLIWVNMILVAFNLIPAFPMDGGRVLRSILATHMAHHRATQIAAGLGQMLAVGLAVVGLMTNWMLVLVAAFVFLAARGEAKLSAVRSSMRGFSVKDAMLRDFTVLPADTQLGHVARLVYSTSQYDFPVIQEQDIVGIISKKDLVQAMSSGGEEQTIAKVMQREVTVVECDDRLDKSFGQMQAGDLESLPVVRSGHLVGMLTLENLKDWLQIPPVWRVRACTAD